MMELQVIQNRILEIRGYKVMLDVHLAELYGVETRALKQAVKRNIGRFPVDFMFELSEMEINQMVSQNVIPSKSYFGGAKPFVFTEQGVAMLSSVLKSNKAVQVNISIMRVFVTIRQYALNYQDLKEKIEAIESKYDKSFEDINQALNYLLSPKSDRKQIGFKQENE
jgi:ORF6N domain